MSIFQSKNRKKLQKAIFGSAGVLFLGGLYYYYFYGNDDEKNKNDCYECDNECENCNVERCCVNEESSQYSQLQSENKNNLIESEKIKTIVNERYSSTARNFKSNQQNSANQVAMAFGYTKDQLNSFGNDSNMGLGCGNPVAQATLKDGEIVMDLGSGGGFDSFLALKKVGLKGKVIGIDMSIDMINRANKNAKRRGYNVGSIENIKNENTNISFYHTEIEDMKLVPSNFVNCIISNCVLNLVPNKLNAFKEIYRVLAKGGRLAVSDIVFKKPWSNNLNKQMSDKMNLYLAGYVGCINGAILKNEYIEFLGKAGFKTIKFINKNVDLNIWKEGWETGGAIGGCCGEKLDSCCGSNEKMNDKNNPMPFSEKEQKGAKDFLKDVDLNEYVMSCYIFAVK